MGRAELPYNGNLPPGCTDADIERAAGEQPEGVECWNCGAEHQRGESCEDCGVLLDEPVDDREDRAYDEQREREDDGWIPGDER